MNILVAYDGANSTPDQKDSFDQALAVTENLQADHTAAGLPVWMDSVIDVLTENCDMVFNLADSVDGKGINACIVPLYLDSIGIPYTGSPSDAIIKTSNKIIAKQIMEGEGIPTPKISTDKYIESNSFFILKSIWEHASIGMDNESIMDSFQKQNGQCYLEQFIDGREFNVSILMINGKPEILPIQEAVFIDWPENKPKIVNYNAKWNKSSFEYQHIDRNFPPDDGTLQNLRDISLKIWDIFGLNGYARIDFRVDEDNNPFVIDINANPCLSPDAGFVAACSQAGIGYNEIIQNIIEHPVRN